MLAEAATPETYQPIIQDNYQPAIIQDNYQPMNMPTAQTVTDRLPEDGWYQQTADNIFNQNNEVDQQAEGEWIPGSSRQNVDIVTYSDYVNGSIFSIPKSWPDQNNDSMLLTVYSFIKTFVSGSGAGQTSIDNRIEQAMDLVKSHLMNAVRSEVEELKEKINKLEDTISHLSRENEILRARASPETLQVLTGSVLSLPGNGGQPPDPAKPPVQQH